MNAIKILLPLLVLAGIATGVYYFLQGEEVTAPPSQHSVPDTTQPAEPVRPVTPDPVVEDSQPRTLAPTDDRIAVDPITPNDPAAPQGVRGRVVLPNRGPAADVDLYLLESTTIDPLRIYLANRMGQKIHPIARTRTAQDGTFAIGLGQEHLGQTFDLRVVPAEYPETQHKTIKVRDGDWYDTGEIQLEVGGNIQGRVVDEQGKFPVGGAKVYLTVPGLNHQMLPTPGRERGIVAETDATGFYRFTNGPRRGIVTIGAEAKDYAWGELSNQQVKEDQLNEFTIELMRGQPIAGIIVDPTGKPVSGATINATAQSAKLPQTATAASGVDGRFRLPMMRPGPYQLMVSAPNFEDVVEKPIFAGSEDVQIVLEQRGLVRVRVLTARGAPIKNYTIGLKRYFPNNPASIGKVPEFRDRRITPSDYEGEYANIRSVPNGEYVFQIQDGQHAKTLSPPFTMSGSKEPPTVDVRLTMGASITGLVVDERGRPVSGAAVATDMNGGLAVDTGFFEMFRSFLPDKHTVATERTGADGRFTLSKLAFADYMLRISHPEFCEGRTLDIKLEAEGETRDVGTIQLQRGAVVEGFCTVAGRRTGQIKVMIGPPAGFRPEVDAAGQLAQMFSATAITDSDGSFRFLKRVPPGTYKIHAFKEAGGDGSDVFGRFKQMKDTERQLVIAPGQETSVQNFNIPM